MLLLMEIVSARTLMDAAGFLASSATLGEADAVDELLLGVTAEIAADAESFPLVQWPGIRMAAPEGRRWAVFFRIKNQDSVELLWICSIPRHQTAA